MKNFRTGLLIFFLTGFTQLFAQSGIYVGGHFRRERTHTINDLKASGFTYVILFNIQVEANGDLSTDGETICSNGTYVFGNTSPNYASDVASLETGISSVNRTESCIGGWGNTSYTNIKSLVNSQGTGTGSILYRNFKALKTAIPSMDAINNDDEGTYDVNSATSFHVMLADVGFKTTLAPYTNKAYWQNLATNVNNQRGGAVDKIYLQWYEGGAGNNPCDWNINSIEMHTGDLYYENGTTVTNKMVSAKNNCGSKGGFIWVYNDNNINLTDQANRINTIYGVKAKNKKEVANFYRNCNNGLFANGLGAGNYTTADLQAYGINNNDISSLTVLEGFEIVLYDGDNFTGNSIVISANSTCLVAAGWNDLASSLRIRTAGVTNLSGTYYMLNRNSGLSMDVHGGTASVNDGDNIQQWNFTGAANQQFAYTHLGDGTYKVIVASSGKSLDVAGIGKDDGTNVHQWTYLASFNQQFVLISTGDGNYKLIPKHSGKLVEVENASKTAGANVRQWGNNNQTCGEWKLIHTNDVPVVSITSPANNVTALETASFTIAATATDVEATITKVEFFNGAIKLGEDLTSPYTFAWNNVSAGTYTVTAKATNQVNGSTTSSAITVKVNKAPTVSITSPGNNAGVDTPATIVIMANANDADGSISKVEFFNGTSKLGEDATSPYAYSWGNVAAGTYSLTAVATDNLGAIKTSVPVTIMVSKTTDIIDVADQSSRINIYPNPTTGIININGEVASVEVLNVNGVLLKTFFTEGEKVIDLSAFANGLYLLKIESRNVFRYERILKVD